VSLWATIIIEVLVVVGAILGWNYFRSGRYKTARQKLQILLAETLRDTNQGEFLFVISRNAKTVEVRLPVCDDDLQRFKDLLIERLKATPHEVELMVAALEDDLTQIGPNVVVWGPVGGDVHVARGPSQHPA
jgi:hypothetical protein